MTESRRRDLLDSITSCMSVLNEETVLEVMRIRGSESIEELSTAELEDVYGDLFQREVDSRD